MCAGASRDKNRSSSHVALQFVVHSIYFSHSLSLQAEFVVAALGCVYYVQSTRVEYEIYAGSNVLPILNYACGGFFGVLFLLRLFRWVASE